MISYTKLPLDQFPSSNILHNRSDEDTRKWERHTTICLGLVLLLHTSKPDHSTTYVLEMISMSESEITIIYSLSCNEKGFLRLQ